MKKLYRAIAAVLATLIMMSVVLTANATAFSDVDADTLGQEVFDAIMYVSDNGIMTGNGDGTFTPNAAMTRAQLAKLLYNHSGASGSYGTVPFTDVPTSAWYYDAVSWAYNNGIVNGYTDTLFNPNGAVTREQTVTMLYRYATDYLGYSFSVSSTLITSHSDYANISTYARTPMNWALGYNIIVPASSSSALLPKTNTIRAVIAQYMFAFEVHVVGYSVEKRLNFINSKTDFGIDASNPRYYISATMLARLRNSINSYYGTGSSAAETRLNWVLKRIEKAWVGACHGMALVTYLDAHGKIDFNGNCGGYASMNAVPKPRTNENVKSGIHYYQVANPLGREFAAQYNKSNSPEKNLLSGINALIDEVELHDSAVFSYFYYIGSGDNTEGHTVLVIDIVYAGNQTYYVTELNPNNIGKTTKTLTINQADGSVVFDGKNLYALEYVSKEEAEAMSFYDVDGESNNLPILGGAADVDYLTLNTASFDDGADETTDAKSLTDDLSGKMILEIPCIPFELKNAAGDSLKYQQGGLSGSLRVYSQRLLSNGEGNVASMVLVIDDTDSISYTSSTVGGGVFACGENYCISVWGEGVSEVYADNSCCIVDGNNFSGTISLSTGVSGWENLTLRCMADSQIRITCGDNLCIYGATGETNLHLSNLRLEFTQDITVMSDPSGLIFDLTQLDTENTISQILAEDCRKTFKLTYNNPGYDKESR